MMVTLADAIIYDDLAQVKKQVSLNTDLNIIDEYGFTPLIEAAIMKKDDVVNFLLQCGADPNFKDTTNRSALFWACDNNHLSMCQRLLEAGADANTFAETGQSALVWPLLRDQESLKNLMVQHGASIEFALNYIYGKLIGHRYQLTGKVHIVSPNKIFLVLDFEGFMLEFTLNVIRSSLQQYHDNYTSRDLIHYFDYLKVVIQKFQQAQELIKLQHYHVNLEQHQHRIKKLLSQEVILIPVVYEGHAITFIKYRDLLAKCDRGANGRDEGCINVYKITQSQYADQMLWQRLLYQKNSANFVHQGLKKILGLRSEFQIPISAQVTGNCSWANAEAVIPTLLFLLMQDHSGSHHGMDAALEIFQAWQQWDRERTLNDYIKNYQQASATDQASIVAILSAVFFKLIQENDPSQHHALQRILPIIKTPKYFYMIRCYLRQFHQKHTTPEGERLKKWLEDPLASLGLTDGSS